MEEPLVLPLDKLIPKSSEPMLDQRIKETMDERRISGRIAWDAVGHRALTLIDEKLGEFDLVKALACAWAELKELRDYRDPALHPRGQEEEFALGENSVKIEAKPELIVQLPLLPAQTIHLGYTVTADFTATTLTICDGAIRAASFSDCEISGQLTLEGQPLHEPARLPKGRLPGHLTFDPPVPIP